MQRHRVNTRSAVVTAEMSTGAGRKRRSNRENEKWRDEMEGQGSKSGAIGAPSNHTPSHRITHHHNLRIFHKTTRAHIFSFNSFAVSHPRGCDDACSASPNQDTRWKASTDAMQRCVSSKANLRRSNSNRESRQRNGEKAQSVKCVFLTAI